MKEFASVHSYERFAASVMREWRYTRSAAQREFLEAMLATSTVRVVRIRKGVILYRAQEGCDWPTTAEEEKGDLAPRAYPPDRMKPFRDRAIEGRVNPRGIPCLYTATRLRTAVAELRPRMGASVSVSQMKVLRPLRVLNCTTKDRSTRIYFSEPRAAESLISSSNVFISYPRYSG
jgi:hypothetical protein